MTTQNPEQQPATNATDVNKKHRARSPSYPAIALEPAIARARELYTKEGMNSASIIVVLKHWGYDAKSGAGLVILAALIKFGLLVDEGSGDKRKARLTELARRIILDDRPVSPERDALIKEAALTPAIHKTLWDQYKGILPSDENLRHELRLERAFTDYGAKEFIEEFRSTVAFAKLTESDIISPRAEDKTQPEGEIQMLNLLADSKPVTPQTQEKNAEPSKHVFNPPQTTKQVPIPLTDAPWGVLQLPFPMTQENWEEFEEFLSHMKGPLTGTRKQKTGEDQGKKD